MEIKLWIKGEEKTFKVLFIKGRMFRRVIELNKENDLNNLEPETIDILVDFVVECFDGQFSRDEFYDGIAADQMIDTILGFMDKISGSGGTADPNKVKG